jgi:hypothetical protein
VVPVANDDAMAVVAADLVSHAGHVESIAQRVTTAADAARSTHAGPEAYGRLCVMVPILLNSLQSIVVDGIDSAAQSLHDTGGRLRSAAAAYGAVDEQSATRLNQVYHGL